MLDIIEIVLYLPLIICILLSLFTSIFKMYQWIVNKITHRTILKNIKATEILTDEEIIILEKFYNLDREVVSGTFLYNHSGSIKYSKIGLNELSIGGIIIAKKCVKKLKNKCGIDLIELWKKEHNIQKQIYRFKFIFIDIDIKRTKAYLVTFDDWEV